MPLPTLPNHISSSRTPGLADRRGLERRWTQLLRQERKLLGPQLQDKVFSLGASIPEQVRDPLEHAFGKAFGFLFHRGMGMIQRSCKKTDLQDGASLRDGLLKEWKEESVKTLEQGAKRAAWGGSLFSTAEGAALGLVGLGLPDVPVILATLLRTICSVALSHGFSCEEEGEQCYLLAVLAAAAAPPEDRAAAFARCDRIGMQLAKEEPVEVPLPTLTEETSALLARRLLLAKTIQGLPLVGLAGGLLGGAFTGLVGEVATVKYQKRTLLTYQLDKGIF